VEKEKTGPVLELTRSGKVFEKGERFEQAREGAKGKKRRQGKKGRVSPGFQVLDPRCLREEIQVEEKNSLGSSSSTGKERAWRGRIEELAIGGNSTSGFGEDHSLLWKKKMEICSAISGSPPSGKKKSPLKEGAPAW